jgi:hypothetical protein
VAALQHGASDYGSIAATSFDHPREVRWTSVGRPLDGTELRAVDDDVHKRRLLDDLRQKVASS